SSAVSVAGATTWSAVAPTAPSTWSDITVEPRPSPGRDLPVRGPSRRAGPAGSGRADARPWVHERAGARSGVPRSVLRAVTPPTTSWPGGAFPGPSARATVALRLPERAFVR